MSYILVSERIKNYNIQQASRGESTVANVSTEWNSKYYYAYKEKDKLTFEGEVTGEKRFSSNLRAKIFNMSYRLG